MDIFGQFLMLLIYLPGLQEITILTLVFISVKLIKKEPWYIAMARSLLVMGIIGVLFWTWFNFSESYRAVLKPVIYVLISGFAWYCLKKGTTTLQKFSLPIVALMFFLFDWQLTYVHREIEQTATWEVGTYPVFDGRKQEDIIQFNYATNCSGAESQELSDYLKSKGDKEVKLTIYALYHYGSLAGYDIHAIDGKDFPIKNSWSGGSCQGNGASNYPEFYLGLRGLTFSKMYPGWKP